MPPTDPTPPSIAAFPAPLRALVQAELRAGNHILSIDRAKPAPPHGACIRFARKVTTHPRQSSPQLRFFEPLAPTHAGEFSDHERTHFIIEPPNNHAIEPDMNAIRDELAARERAANCDRFRPDGGLW